jgi:hypothetical protein
MCGTVSLPSFIALYSPGAISCWRVNLKTLARRSCICWMPAMSLRCAPHTSTSDTGCHLKSSQAHKTCPCSGSTAAIRVSGTKAVRRDGEPTRGRPSDWASGWATGENRAQSECAGWHTDAPVCWVLSGHHRMAARPPDRLPACPHVRRVVS